MIKVTPIYEKSEPPPRQTNKREARIRNAEAREKIRGYLETMETGQSFIVEGMTALEVRCLVRVQNDYGCFGRHFETRTIEPDKVRVWFTERKLFNG